MKKMITVDIKNRIKPKDVIKHPWFEKVLKKKQGNQELDASTILKLKEFKGSSVLRKGALNILVKMLKPSEIANLKE